ncbi:unnamed protein product [Effrenium voratum]|nr:unnamed protein product [Effrenium voratum]
MIDENGPGETGPVIMIVALAAMAEIVAEGAMTVTVEEGGWGRTVKFRGCLGLDGGYDRRSRSHSPRAFGPGGRASGNWGGDWVCEKCDCNNFARRDDCFRYTACAERKTGSAVGIRGGKKCRGAWSNKSQRSKAVIEKVPARLVESRMGQSAPSG